MKATLKKVVMTAVLVLLAMGTAAAEGSDGFSFAGFWKSDSLRSGGSMELGLPTLYEKNGFIVRSNLELAGAGIGQNADATGCTTLTAKITMGGKYEKNGLYMKSYGFSYGGGSLLFPGSAVEYGFDFGGGGGFEIGFTDTKAAFVVEYGGGWFNVPETCFDRNQSTQSFGYNFLTLGWRQYY